MAFIHFLLLLQEDTVDVLFVDYGNPVTVRKDHLRKDLIGMELPRVAIALTLDGVELTDNFDGGLIHERFYGKLVQIELKESPNDQFNGKSLRAVIHLDDEKSDMATLLVSKDIARRV